MGWDGEAVWLAFMGALGETQGTALLLCRAHSAPVANPRVGWAGRQRGDLTSPGRAAAGPRSKLFFLAKSGNNEIKRVV